ncbi:hypothetical protein BHE74_00026017 [Ensete ventricosum]|nr:hypothetical protein BHE74_00026017 [Ensete ventricosum]RZR84515.1 hypothetical protein BHM03_00011365 [Ensete ventricosum]
MLLLVITEILRFLFSYHLHLTTFLISSTNQGSAPPHEDLMQTDDTIDNGPLRPSFPLFSATRDVNPFSLLDSKFGLFSSLFDSGGASSFPRLGPRVSHPREVKEIPIDFKDNNRGCGPSGVGPRIEEVTGNETAHGHEIHGTVIIDDEDDDGIQPTHGGHGAKSSADTSLGQCAGPSVSPLADMTDYSNEIEEEMIKAAIEASKREAQQHDIHDHPKSPATDDTDLARAVSLSLKAQQEAQLCLLEEAAAREAALHKQKHEEEENQRKQLEEEVILTELEMKLAAKQSLLPQEPSSDDGNAVTLLVRMPDGSRHGRRFLKSDKLQLLFDYIDVGKVVKPSSYRLVILFS